MEGPVKLTAQLREQVGTIASRRLRRQGLVPAILYGHGEQCVHLAVQTEEIEHALREGAHMVELRWNGHAETALVKDVQYDAFDTRVVHLDFARVAMDEAITVSVEIELRGNAPGVKEGGVLDHVMREVEVACLPTNIPETIRVDISELNIGDTVRLQDVKVPEGVEVLGEPEAPVAILHPPVAAEEPEEAEEEEAEAAAEPEVITESKREEAEEDKSDEGRSRPAR